jgi:hypothetical protein
MWEIYDRRASYLKSKGARTQHARQLLDDTLSYVGELELAQEDCVMLWRITADDKSSYALFEGVSSRRFLGCIHVVDKRKVSLEEWSVLWGK